MLGTWAQVQVKESWSERLDIMGHCELCGSPGTPQASPSWSLKTLGMLKMLSVAWMASKSVAVACGSFQTLILRLKLQVPLACSAQTTAYFTKTGMVMHVKRLRIN